jgi:hypothetical protein
VAPTTDPGLARAWDASVLRTAAEDRVATVAWLRHIGQQRVWAQADRARLADPCERAVFALDRLYPRLPTAHRDAFVRQLRMRWSKDAGAR